MNIRLQNRTDGVSSLGCPFFARVGSRRIRRASVLIVACWLFWDPSLKAQTRSGENVEYPVKLAFLYNFTKFVEWPSGSYPNADSPLAICVVGEDPFSPATEKELRTRTVGGHPVEIK